MKKYLDKKVIIRSDRAGVFYGTLVSVEPLGDKLQVEMQNCRRFFYWSGAASLTQLSQEGTARPKDCKFTMAIESVGVVGIIEILPCTEQAINNIESVEVWKI